jgi:LDH2 family malate/lactate/ureidoglycolate dehydrogenase
MQAEKLNYSAKELENFSKKVFLYMGHSEKNAELAAKVLITADLRGIDSHGIASVENIIRKLNVLLHEEEDKKLGLQH